MKRHWWLSCQWHIQYTHATSYLSLAWQLISNITVYPGHSTCLRPIHKHRCGLLTQYIYILLSMLVWYPSQVSESSTLPNCCKKKSSMILPASLTLGVQLNWSPQNVRSHHSTKKQIYASDNVTRLSKVKLSVDSWLALDLSMFITVPNLFWTRLHNWLSIMQPVSLYIINARRRNTHMIAYVQSCEGLFLDAVHRMTFEKELIDSPWMRSEYGSWGMSCDDRRIILLRNHGEWYKRDREGIRMEWCRAAQQGNQQVSLTGPVLPPSLNTTTWALQAERWPRTN